MHNLFSNRIGNKSTGAINNLAGKLMATEAKPSELVSYPSVELEIFFNHYMDFIGVLIF